MYRSFDLVRAIERLLVRGNIEEARALALSIASAPEPAAFEPWARQLALVRKRATELAAATFVDDACMRAARLAEACATCHLETDAVARFAQVPELPADQPTIEARMQRHRWAADRLWEGMIGYADQPWRAGLDVLAETPLPFGVIGEQRIMIGRRLQVIADEARRRPTAERDSLAARTETYGEILATCAGCHATPANEPRAIREVP
jgi:cytochrome c553